VSGAMGGARPTVVLVDDSQEVRAVVRMLLQSSGFKIVGEGGDGDEGILLAFRHRPDLLLLDTSMPKVDGVEALPAILALSPETKVVMFTGFEEPQLATRARELGAAAFIEKSIPLEELPDRLLEVVAGPQGGVRVGGPSPIPTSAGPSGGGGQAVDYELRADRVEQAVLSEHVQQFRELFDRAEIGMATLTSSGTVVRANRALAALMSCEPYDLVGVDYGRLTGGRGEDLDHRLDDISSLGADLTSFEHFLPSPPGVEPSRMARATLAPIRDANRRVLYIFAQVQDVTAQRAVESELRRSEENFRRLVTAVREYAIFMLDVDGHVVSWNAGARRIKGYVSHEIVGRHFRVFYGPEDQATRHPEQNLETALREGGFAEEGWRVRRDGTQFWASVVITPVFDDAGEHVGFAKVTRDQSQQREHEEERRAFVDERIQLLAVTAHELHNPTAVIDGAAGALGRSSDQMSSTQREELIANIHSSADRLRRLAADLARAARSGGETLPLRLDQVSLTEILSSAAARLQAARPDILLELDVPAEVVIRADEGRLAQALDNLLDNAVRHGAPPIGLRASVDGDVSIRVTDGGPGIPSELAQRLFQQFATSGADGGTGLGLFLVREIARRHGGEVTYRPPADGRPTTFEITLPLASP
jgi:PAS domain S-box-containing protein